MMDAQPPVSAAAATVIDDQAEREQRKEEEEEEEGERDGARYDVTPSSKTFTIEIIESEGHSPADPQDDIPGREDPESDPPYDQVRKPHAAPSSRQVGRRRNNGKRRCWGARGKNAQKILESLSQTLNPIPFRPSRAMDFSSNEFLLKRLGLWDFVHLRFDFRIRPDLIAQLIANFKPTNSCSYVNGARIKVSRADLARALKLPAKKDSAAGGEGKETQGSAAFLQELVSNWMLLHEDTWIMPVEVLNWSNLIKEGSYEKVDWASLIWFMVKEELAKAPMVGDCYYASHLQYLIKSQRHDLVEENPVRPVLHNKVEGDASAEAVNKEADRHGGNERTAEEDAINLSEGKEGKKRWCRNNSDNPHFLQPCVLQADEGKMEAEAGEVEEEPSFDLFQKSSALIQNPDEAMEAEQTPPPAETQSIMDPPFLHANNNHGHNHETGIHSTDEMPHRELNICRKKMVAPDLDGCIDQIHHLAEKVRAFQLYSLDDHSDKKTRNHEHRDANPSSDLISCFDQMHHLVEKVKAIYAGKRGREEQENKQIYWFDFDPPLHLGNGSKKQETVKELQHCRLHDGNKRMKMNGSWSTRSSDLGGCFVQLHEMLENMQVLSDAKEQALEEMNTNQQRLMKELHQRDELLHHVQKARLEEQQKKEMEVYGLERELHVMGKLLEEYRRCLKETDRTFAEYRTRSQLSEEPIYKDAGPNGLVLSTIEAGRLLKKKEEERLSCLLIESQVVKFEETFSSIFEGQQGRVQLLGSKLLNLKKRLFALKKILASTKQKNTLIM